MTSACKNGGRNRVGYARLVAFGALTRKQDLLNLLSNIRLLENTLGTTFVRLVKEEMATKTISNRVNRSLRGGHFVMGPVLFPAVSF